MRRDETQHTVYLGLGTNLGDRHSQIERAVALIGQHVGPVVRRSTVVESQPWGFASCHPFLNAVVSCETTLSPRQVLAATQLIERQLGKTAAHATHRSKDTVPHPAPDNAPTPAYHDRPIDIDILLYDDLTVDEPGLTIPHPLMEQRDFVMGPLSEIRTKITPTDT